MLISAARLPAFRAMVTGFRWRVLIAYGVAAALGSGTGTAWAQAAGSQISLAGSVTNRLTGAQVKGATVVVRPVAKSAGGAAASTSPAGRSAALTDSTGHFSVSGVVSGRYFVTVEKSGYISSNYRSSESDGALTIDQSKTIDVQLTQCGAIAGRIADSNGEDLAGATVVLYQSRLAGDKITMTSINQTSSNDLGAYRFFDLLPGRYYVAAHYRDAASVYGLRLVAKDSAVNAGDSTEDYIPTWYPGTSEASSAVPVKLRGGESNENVNLQVRMARSAVVEGSVENVPGNATVRVMLTTDGQVSLGAHQDFPLEPGNTHFFFKSVPPGQYTLRAEVNRPGASMSAIHRLIVTDVPARNISLSLQPSPSIRGRIVMKDGSALPDGVQIVVGGLDGTRRMPVRPGPKGQFGISAIQPDVYRFLITAPAHFLIASAHVNGQPVDPMEFRVEGPIDDLSIELTSALAKIAGTASDAHSERTNHGLAVAVWVGKGGYDYTAEIDPQGQFEFDDVLPGEYRVISFDDVDSRDDMTIDALRTVIDRGTQVEAKENTTATINTVSVQADR
jgi:Carboxypeptidase regulatory-like domain